MSRAPTALCQSLFSAGPASPWSFERAFKFEKIALQTEVSPKTATSPEKVALSAELKLNNRLRPGKVIGFEFASW